MQILKNRTLCSGSINNKKSRFERKNMFTYPLKIIIEPNLNLIQFIRQTPNLRECSFTPDKIKFAQQSRAKDPGIFGLVDTPGSGLLDPI